MGTSRGGRGGLGDVGQLFFQGISVVETLRKIKLWAEIHE